MATSTVARCATHSKVSFAKSTRSVRVARRFVCRAEEKAEEKVEKAVTKAVDRSKDVLHFTSESTLKYLDGSLPGDFGFDPLGLLDPANSGGLVTPEWLKYSEVIHCRFAMLGAAGCLGPEVLGKAGLIPEATNIAWFQSGVIPRGGTYTYWTDPYSLVWIEIVAMQFAELRRLQDWKNPGCLSKQYFLGLEQFFEGTGNPSYPGGKFFNFAGFGKTEAELNKMKLSEVKNGRLAMIAIFAFGAQGTLTRVGPFQNLLDHLSDPINNNILGNFGKVYGGA